jgi:hypothetical protein
MPLGFSVGHDPLAHLGKKTGEQGRAEQYSSEYFPHYRGLAEPLRNLAEQPRSDQEDAALDEER